MADAARQAGERRELRKGIRRQSVRLEPAPDLARHYLEGLLLDQRDRVELGVEQPGDRIRLRERLADERERRREPDVAPDGGPLQIGEGLTGLDRGERTAMEA